MHQVGALLSCVLGGWASLAGETAPGVQEGIPVPSVASRKAGDRQLQMEQAICHQYPGMTPCPPPVILLEPQVYQIVLEWTFRRLKDALTQGSAPGVCQAPYQPGRRIASGSALFPGLSCPESGAGGWEVNYAPLRLKMNPVSSILRRNELDRSSGDGLMSGDSVCPKQLWGTRGSRSMDRQGELHCQEGHSPVQS